MAIVPPHTTFQSDLSIKKSSWIFNDSKRSIETGLSMCISKITNDIQVDRCLNVKLTNVIMQTDE